MTRLSISALSLSLLFAASCVSTVEDRSGESSSTGELAADELDEDPVPSGVEELDDGTITAAWDEGGTDELPEGVIASLGRRRVCAYEGRFKTGRASCWYAPAGRGVCRNISRITAPDYCGASGCVRDNTVSSLWINADTLGLRAVLYVGVNLTGKNYTYSVYTGNRYSNLSSSTSVKENEASSLRVCNYQ